jgi:hypothetical protein
VGQQFGMERPLGLVRFRDRRQFGALEETAQIGVGDGQPAVAAHLQKIVAAIGPDIGMGAIGHGVRGRPRALACPEGCGGAQPTGAKT